MLLGDRGSRWRCLLVWSAGSSALGAVMLLVRPEAGTLWSARASLAALPLDVALADLSAGMLLGCAAWAWLALSATVVEAWRGVSPERHRPWHLPGGVRRAVLAACGVALASGMSTPALADGGPSPRHLHGLALLSGLPLPDRAVAPARSPASHATRVVIVRPGDSLWSIAERDLPPGAPDRAIVTRWHAIYAANRSHLGPDPDLLEPGQDLILPRKDDTS